MFTTCQPCFSHSSDLSWCQKVPGCAGDTRWTRWARDDYMDVMDKGKGNFKVQGPLWSPTCWFPFEGYWVDSPCTLTSSLNSLQKEPPYPSSLLWSSLSHPVLLFPTHGTSPIHILSLYTARGEILGNEKLMFLCHMNAFWWKRPSDTALSPAPSYCALHL